MKVDSNVGKLSVRLQRQSGAKKNFLKADALRACRDSEGVPVNTTGTIRHLAALI